MALSADGNTIVVGRYKPNVTFVAVYDWTGTAWVQRGSSLTGTQIGWRVKINNAGNRIAYSTCRGDGNVVLIYDYDGASSSWVQTGSLSSTGSFGSDIDLNAQGDVIIIGSNHESVGKVRVYAYSNGAWTQRGSTINTVDLENNLGTAVSVNADGTTISMNMVDYQSASRNKVYTFDGTAWNLIATIDGPSSFGNAMSLNAAGSILVLGSPYYNGDSSLPYKGYTSVYGPNPPATAFSLGDTCAPTVVPTAAPTAVPTSTPTKQDDSVYELSRGAVAGIVLGAIFVALLVVVDIYILQYFWSRGGVYQNVIQSSGGGDVEMTNTV